MSSDSKKKYFDIAPPASRTFLKESSTDPEDLPAGVPPLDAANDQAAKDAISSDPTLQSDTLVEPEEANEDKGDNVSHKAFTITPPNSNTVDADKEIKKEDKTTDSKDVDKSDDKIDSEVIPKPATESTKTEKGKADDQLSPTLTPEPSELATEEGEPELSTKPVKVTNPSTAEAADTNPEVNSATEPKPAGKDVPAPTEQFAVADSLPDPGEQAANAAKADMQTPKLYDTKEYYVPIGHAHHKHGGVKGAFIFGIICAMIVVVVVVYLMFIIDK